MRVLWVVGLLACSSTPTPRDPSPPAPSLLAAIELGDLERTKLALCAAYAERGMECAEPLRMNTIAPTDVMSRYWDVGMVSMQPMPPVGGGFAYWDNWSALLSGGTWQPRALFDDDDDARRVANMLLATVLAHELGHHLASGYDCSLSGPAGELRADEISVPLIRELATGKLGELHTKMRTVADALISAVPQAVRVEVPADADARAWTAKLAELPQDTRSYAGLHLSRQRALLAAKESFAVSTASCVEPFKARLARRRVLPGHVRTVRRISVDQQRAAAFDAAGRLYSTPRSGEDKFIVITPHDGGDPIRIPIEARPMVDAFAAFSPTRFAVMETVTVYMIDASTKPPLVQAFNPPSLPRALAFDRDGTLYGATSDETWSVFELPSERVRWTGTPAKRYSQADGPVATADLTLTQFAIAGEVLVTASDRTMRLVERGAVSTLAGGVWGLRDGVAAIAKLFEVVGLHVRADGTIWFVEHAGGHLVVRTLERR